VPQDSDLRYTVRDAGVSPIDRTVKDFHAQVV
jgi:hypothetical protein